MWSVVSMVMGSSVDDDVSMDCARRMRFAAKECAYTVVSLPPPGVLLVVLPRPLPAVELLTDERLDEADEEEVDEKEVADED